MAIGVVHAGTVALPAPPDTPGDLVYHGDGPSGMDVFVKTAFEYAFGAQANVFEWSIGAI